MGGDPAKIAALRAGELRILARGAALKKIAALRAAIRDPLLCPCKIGRLRRPLVLFYLFPNYLN